MAQVSGLQRTSKDSKISEFFDKIKPTGDLQSKVPCDAPKLNSGNFEMKTKKIANSQTHNFGDCFPLYDENPAAWTIGDKEGLPVNAEGKIVEISNEMADWQFNDMVHKAFKQDVILQQIKSKQDYFNEQIKHAKYVKSLCQVHILSGKLAADMLLQESWLLGNFEASEQASEDRVQSRLKDLQEAKRSKIDSERKLENKQLNIQELQAKLKDLDDEFHTLLPDNQKAADWLTKVYKKKIKRKKSNKNKDNENGENSGSESDSDSDSDSDFSDDFSEDEGFQRLGGPPNEIIFDEDS